MENLNWIEIAEHVYAVIVTVIAVTPTDKDNKVLGRVGNVISILFSVLKAKKK